jgi:uncharacterized protein
VGSNPAAPTIYFSKVSGRASRAMVACMAKLGEYNQLPVVRRAPQGLYLDGGARGEILLPQRYAPESVLPGELLEIFLYRDSEDRLVATTETPHAVVGQFACLEVVSAQPDFGAFLDWGLAKDLLLPMREQDTRVAAGERVVVYILVDPRSDRVIASTRLNRFLNQTPPEYEERQAVDLLITGETPLGYNAIVNDAHRGLLYHEGLAARLPIGLSTKGYIRTVRVDGKIDLSLDPAGYSRVRPLADQILEALTAAGGWLELDDSSPPEAVRAAFGASKKAFKQALGNLYRQRLVVFSNGGTSLAGKG